MIDYHKLKPFKVDCKSEQNSQRLQKLLKEQGIDWRYPSEAFLAERVLLEIHQNNVITYFIEEEDFFKEITKELSIEKLLPKPKLKKFLKEFKKDENRK